MEKYDVIVLGGGAAGLMCAATAGRRGRRVLLLEKSNKIGKKILMSGGGRCNFTNLNTAPEYYVSHNPHFCISALSQYTQWDFIALVEQYSIAYHEKTLGQLFCDDSSKDILNMLRAECERVKVEIRTNSDVKKINYSAGKYNLELAERSLYCESLVVATGGLSIPKMGGSGFGYEIAQQFDLRVLPRTAGLVPFVLTDHSKAIAEHLSGVSVAAEVSTCSNSFAEAILFTHRGLSGPAILQASSYWAVGEPIFINLLPQYDMEIELINIKMQQPKTLLRNVLAAMLPKKLVIELQQQWWSKVAQKPMAEISDTQLLFVAKNLQAWEVKPAGTEGYRTAEVTLGGVDTDELSSKTMQSSKQPGLYFIGEVVDVTGHLGGYNFQWAWSSGVVAGLSV